MCVCVDCACPTGDWPPCDRPVLTEPARVPLLARCRTGAAAAGHLHLHALLPWNALCCPGAWTYMLRENRSVPVLLSRTGWRNRWRPVRCRRTSPGSAWSESLTQLMCRFCVMAVAPLVALGASRERPYGASWSLMAGTCRASGAWGSRSEPAVSSGTA